MQSAREIRSAESESNPESTVLVGVGVDNILQTPTPASKSDNRLYQVKFLNSQGKMTCPDDPKWSANGVDLPF